MMKYHMTAHLSTLPQYLLLPTRMKCKPKDLCKKPKLRVVCSLKQLQRYSIYLTNAMRHSNYKCLFVIQELQVCIQIQHTVHTQKVFKLMLIIHAYLYCVYFYPDHNNHFRKPNHAGYPVSRLSSGLNRVNKTNKKKAGEMQMSLHTKRLQHLLYPLPHEVSETCIFKALVLLLQFCLFFSLIICF